LWACPRIADLYQRPARPPGESLPLGHPAPAGADDPVVAFIVYVDAASADSVQYAKRVVGRKVMAASPPLALRVNAAASCP